MAGISTKPTGYKQTDVGIIPTDWEIRKLGELFEITSSKRVFQSEWQTSGIPFYRARELAVLSEQGYIKNELFISKDLYASFKNKYGVPQIYDMLVTGVGTLGKVYVIPNNHEFYFKDGNIIWFKISGKVNPYFLRQLYLTKTVIKQIEDASAGTTVGTYTISGAKKTLIPFPSLLEQSAIAAVLSDTDSLIESLEKLIAKKCAIKQGAMQELLTGKRRLPGFNGEWEIKSLGEIARVNMGQSPGSINYNQYGIGIPLIQGNADIEDRKSINRVWTTQITKTCDAGDLILTVRAPVGLIAIANEHACLGRGVCSLKPISVDIRFLFHAMILAENQWKFLEQGSTFTAANSAQIMAFKLKVPNDKGEQITIASALSDMDSEIKALEKKLEKYIQIKQGMMQVLLTGKIRLHTN